MGEAPSSPPKTYIPESQSCYSSGCDASTAGEETCVMRTVCSSTNTCNDLSFIELVSCGSFTREYSSSDELESDCLIYAGDWLKLIFLPRFVAGQVLLQENSSYFLISFTRALKMPTEGDIQIAERSKCTQRHR